MFVDVGFMVSRLRFSNLFSLFVSKNKLIK
jgi:hypothetical protein